MRSNKGITLVSLIIYMIVFSVVIGITAMLTGYFRNNIDELSVPKDSPEQYTRFTTYLTNDINSINFKSIETEDSILKITLLDETEHQYLYNNEKIYYVEINNKGNIQKKVTLCNNIKYTRFSYEENKLKTIITIGEITYNNNYTIK